MEKAQIAGQPSRGSEHEDAIEKSADTKVV
jgi:hypothetical protein